MTKTRKSAEQSIMSNILRKTQSMNGQTRGEKDTQMAQRTWLDTYPRIKAVLQWDAFLDALFSDHPYPEYYGCILCQTNGSTLIEVDFGSWEEGEQSGRAIPSTETRSWGLLFRDRISYLLGVHCVCQSCLL